MQITLVGMPGSGKTTLGAILAESLGYQFIDTDDCLERQYQQAITEIMHTAGEAKFRIIESQLLREKIKEKNAILATGGGIVLKPDNRRLLTEADCVIYLEVDLARLIKRLEPDDSRPLLSGSLGKEELLKKLYDERQTHYEAVADIKFNNNYSDLKQAAEACLAMIKHSIKGV